MTAVHPSTRRAAWIEGFIGVGRDALALARQTLREIFDESAYERFLKRRGLQSSRDAYAEFLREAETGRARRPRCC